MFEKLIEWKAFGFLLLGLNPAFALAADDDTEKEATYKAEIVVTAEKKESPLIKVPASVSVLTRENLESADVNSINDAGYYVPNLFVSGFSAKRTSFPYLRGIGSGQGEPAVTTYIDGVPQLSPNTASIDFLDLERIEFLRGPQGSLYGRNTIGGLVHYITSRPGNDFRFGAGASFGDSDYSRLKLSADGPLLKDRIFFSIGAAFTERDGFSQNGLSGRSVDTKDGDYLRGSLMFTPNESWRIRINAFNQKDRDGGFILYDLGSLRAQPYQLLHDLDGVANRDVNQTAVTVNHFGSQVDLTVIAAVSGWDAVETTDLDFTPLDFLIRDLTEEQDQTYFEARLNGSRPLNLGNVGLQWVVGASFFTSELKHNSVNELRPTLTQLPFSLTESAAYSLDDEGLGVFGQLTLTFNKNLDLILGARYVDEEKKADLNLISQIIPPPINVAQSKIANNYDEILPRVALAYHWERMTAHLSASKGYRSGGYNLNTTPTGPFNLNPETGWTYETGLKAGFWDNRIFLAATLFSLDWDDMQLSVPNPIIPGRFFLDNVGQARNQGAEFELSARLNQNWDLSLGLGLLDAEFREYIDPVSGQDVAGNSLPNAPDSNWSAALAYRSDRIGGFNFVGRAEAFGLGAQAYDALNSEGQSSYMLANFRFGLEYRGLSLEAWVRNAFDEEYLPIAIPSSFSPSGWAAEMGSPRVAGLSIGYKY